MDISTGQILRTSFCRGRDHDFTLFKQKPLPLPASVIILSDLGYMGIKKFHSSAGLPTKSSKHKKLTKEQKAANRQLRKQRIVIEHLFAFVKRFKIFALPYRNRRKRFMLRFNLFAAVFNLERKIY